MGSCPGRGAAFFTLLRRAGTHQAFIVQPWAPDQQRTATALRSIRGTTPTRKGGLAAAPL
jgi:hypothetical protein